jgi:tRNA threonylcarbamoyl adenosine modification protein (Sua5/YciO/YrdC/YwlC family)
MARLFTVHPVTPEARLINQAVAMMRKGAVIVYPTDSGFALGCQLGDRSAQERIRRIRQLDDRHNFTLVCRDLSEIATYAKVDNQAYRLMKSLTPGAYTFILPATHETPRRLQNPKRKTIGIRVPEHPVASALLSALGEPVMSSTLLLPGEDDPLTDVEDITRRIGGVVDAIIESGHCGLRPTTVVDLTGDAPEVLRFGAGDPSPFGARPPLDDDL